MLSTLWSWQGLGQHGGTLGEFLALGSASDHSYSQVVFLPNKVVDWKVHLELSGVVLVSQVKNMLRSILTSGVDNLELCMGFLSDISIDIGAFMIALLQCGSSPKACGSMMTSPGACHTWTSLLGPLINGPKYRDAPLHELMQIQLGFGQGRSPRETIKNRSYCEMET